MAVYKLSNKNKKIKIKKRWVTRTHSIKSGVSATTRTKDSGSRDQNGKVMEMAADNGIWQQTTDDSGIMLQPLHGNDSDDNQNGDRKQQQLWEFGLPVAHNGNGTVVAYNKGTGSNGLGTWQWWLTCICILRFMWHERGGWNLTGKQSASQCDKLGLKPLMQDNYHIASYIGWKKKLRKMRTWQQGCTSIEKKI